MEVAAEGQLHHMDCHRRHMGLSFPFGHNVLGQSLLGYIPFIAQRLLRMIESFPSDDVLAHLRNGDQMVPLSRRQVGRLAVGAGWSLMVGGFLSGCATVAIEHPDSSLASSVTPFSGATVSGGLPQTWEPYVIRRHLKRTHYGLVERDGRTVLRAFAENASSGLHSHVRIDPLATPWLRWSWLVDKVHTQATVADDDMEDAPARIVLAFEGDMSKLALRDRLFFEQVELFTGNRLPYATLVYVWDGQLPAERVVPYVRSKRLQFKVVETGVANQGRWLDYERNVVEDFKQVFGELPPGNIISVGVLTDSDDLKNSSEAWYGDLSFSANAGGVVSVRQP